MAGLSYTTYIQQVALMAVVDSVSDANFVTLIPSMIDYAEKRLYRDLDLMEVSAALSGPSYTIPAGTRQVNFPKTLPDGSAFTVSEQINLILPAPGTDPEAGTRVPLTPVTKEFLDAVYGSTLVANRAQPIYYAPFNDATFLVGPVADQTYGVEIIGTVRPASLSPSNTTTFLSTYFPDLLIMASMIYISGYQRNFGRQADDPQMAMSYETQYQLLLKGAVSEENRKKYEASAWSSQGSSSTATPGRG